MLSSLLVFTLAAIAPFARADVYITSPTATTSLAAGQQGTIVWQDNNNGSSLAAIGPCLVGLYVGNTINQALLQTLGTAVDVSKNNSLTWTPDPTVAPNGQYFIRFQSNNLKDNTTGYPYEAFSAKFTLTGMTGTLSPSDQSLINGASASGASPTVGTAPSTTPHTPTSSGSSPSTVKATGAGAAAAASGSSTTTKKNGVGHMVVPRVLGATGVAAVAFAFFL